MLLVSIVGLKGFSQQKKSSYLAPLTTEKDLKGTVKLYENLRYGKIPDYTTNSSSDRILDLYIPDTASKINRLPLFLFIHGGGFSGGDKGLTDLCTKIAEKGYVVASINYRLALKDNKIKDAGCGANMSKGLPVSGKFHPMLENAINIASEDAASSLKWLTKNANTYYFNTQKVVVCGGSAGSMTALYLAYVVKPKEVKISAVVDLWGGLENAEVIQKDSPPLLIYHGDEDQVINVAYAYALNDRMEQLGIKGSKIVIMKDKGHAQYKYIANLKIEEIDDFLKPLIKSRR